MKINLVSIIRSEDPGLRDNSLDALCREASMEELLMECGELESFRRNSGNLYERVRALFFLYAIHRFHLPYREGFAPNGRISYTAYEHLLHRRFEEAIQQFLRAQDREGANEAASSGLAEAYKKLAIQTLADQVKRSVRSTLGNQWMFRTGHPEDHPLRVRPELLRPDPQTGLFPVLHESTPVRMDISHSGWSDIFFLGMDFPEGANVMNVSIDLTVRRQGRDGHPRPPIETFFRVIDRPVLRLTSIDLNASADISQLSEVFDFARDYLGLIKAAVIASGLVPPGLEGANQTMADLLGVLVAPGMGVEIVSQVNGIPKGSRLAVSTNLLASLIAVCMRATGQAKSLDGGLDEAEKRLVAARAILGEWLGGSGGGWQDSGGVWPGIKIIQGVQSSPGDPEWGISRGRLLPSHSILGLDQVSDDTRRKLQDSLILVHGGMAQDVGPVLEMVTEKYLLRSEAEWAARQEAIRRFYQLVDFLKQGDIEAIGRHTHKNFHGPIQSIIPWAGNLYTETLIRRVKEEFGGDFWGFWMLGGMAGGGMGFLFNPSRKPEAQDRLFHIMQDTKRTLERAVPFAMDPVVYDFAINERGSWAELRSGPAALLPTGYYAIRVPELLRKETRELGIGQRRELERLGEACRNEASYSGFVATLFDRVIPQGESENQMDQSLESLLLENGFDQQLHRQIRDDLKGGRIGLSQNRLPVSTGIEDVRPGDVYDALRGTPANCYDLGMDALRRGELAVVSLAGGAGSRWTKGAGVVKSLHPFAMLCGKHRTFVETHLAKSRRISRQCGCWIPHIFTTSYLTHSAIADTLDRERNYGYGGQVLLSPGRSIGLRLIPTTRDLRFQWEETTQQVLDEQAQKMRESLHKALISWAQSMGEGGDYTDNVPQQCVHPVGHWYEVPNLLLNGTLEQLIRERPGLRYLMVHNIDTLGANPDPCMLGLHIESGCALSTEVIHRRIDDRGGGLARIDGRLRLVEGLALPDERIEFDLTYYNSSTTWVDIDQMLSVFGIKRSDLEVRDVVREAVRSMARRMPTYITIKEVKKRWGKGQEDIFPVTQWEKLWGDMTALPELSNRFVAVPRTRGQQLKEIAQLDGWLRDGSAAYVESVCDFD